jgi:hypothetical protein
MNSATGEPIKLNWANLPSFGKFKIACILSSLGPVSASLHLFASLKVVNLPFAEIVHLCLFGSYQVFVGEMGEQHYPATAQDPRHHGHGREADIAQVLT